LVYFNNLRAGIGRRGRLKTCYILCMGSNPFVDILLFYYYYKLFSVSLLLYLPLVFPSEAKPTDLRTYGPTDLRTYGGDVLNTDNH
jgi:hypothetical protein